VNKPSTVVAELAPLELAKPPIKPVGILRRLTTLDAQSPKPKPVPEWQPGQPIDSHVALLRDIAMGKVQGHLPSQVLKNPRLLNLASSFDPVLGESAEVTQFMDLVRQQSL